MSQRKNLHSKKNGTFHLSDYKKFQIGNALRITGIIALLVPFVLIFTAADIFFVAAIIVVMSYFTFPVVPIFLIIIGQRLVAKSKIKYKI